MNTYIVHNPDGPDFEFLGELLAEQRSSDLGNVKIYRTQASSFVAEQNRRGLYGRRAINRAATFQSLPELADWLGHSRDAKSILEKIGHAVRTRVE